MYNISTAEAITMRKHCFLNFTAATDRLRCTAQLLDHIWPDTLTTAFGQINFQVPKYVFAHQLQALGHTL
jgi:hypothetical protein